MVIWWGYNFSLGWYLIQKGEKIENTKNIKMTTWPNEMAENLNIWAKMGLTDSKMVLTYDMLIVRISFRDIAVIDY